MSERPVNDLPDGDVALAIQALYDAALSGVWEPALRRLCDAAGWRHVRLQVAGRNGFRVAAAASHEEDVSRRRGDGPAAPRSDVLLPASDDWQRIVLEVDGATDAALWVVPSARVTRCSEAWLRLHSHMGQALSLALDAAQRAWYAGQLARDADCSPIGRLVVGTELEVRYVNRAAHAMAAGGDAFMLDGGKLLLRRPSDQAAVVGLVRSGAAAMLDEATYLSWPRRSGRWPYAVRIAPLGAPADPCFELTLIDRDPDDPPCDPLILAGFDLTPAEARVVRALLEGYSHAEIAQRSGIARGTVKLHVEHAMKKLGVRRRPQLMRRLLAPLIARVPGCDAEALFDSHAVHLRRAELGPGYMANGIVGPGDTGKDTGGDAG